MFSHAIESFDNGVVTEHLAMYYFYLTAGFANLLEAEKVIYFASFGQLCIILSSQFSLQLKDLFKNYLLPIIDCNILRGINV